MSRRLFITRPLPKNAPLRKQLEADGFEVTGQSMLQFEAIKIEAVAATDWLFAYSPRGVKLFLSQQLAEQKGDQLHLKSGALKLAAVGPGTAEAWQNAGLTVDFIGDGEPLTTAAAFAKTHCTETTPKVTFLQAENSRRSVEKPLTDHIHVQRLSIYRSVINEAASIHRAEVYYLTSPLSAEAVLRQVDQTHPFDIWCVGSVTAGHVRELEFRVQRIRPLV
ncbi:MAG: uroporphyrinogen-III synthase [Saprospiraceae bacterium]